MERLSLKNIISSRRALFLALILFPIVATAVIRQDDVNIVNAVKIGAVGTANAKSVLDAASTTKGVLLPRMTTTQQNAISSPVEGLIIYDNVLHGLVVYDGSQWRAIFDAGNLVLNVPGASTLGGVFSHSSVSNNFLTSINTDGTVSNAQPAFTNISGTATVAQGGTGQTTYTDGQLLIGNTSGNTLTKASLTAGSNITITPGNGSITIAASSGSSAQWNYVGRTTTYNPASINDFIVASNASFAITLPDATTSGYAGKSIIIVHGGSSLSQVYTLNTTSSQTIGGIASGVYKLSTNGETLWLMSDGANWQIVAHETNTDWISYTPSTCAGFSGTVCTAYNFYYRRTGKTLSVKGTMTTGTVQVALGAIAIPTNTSIDSTKLLAATTSGPCPSVGKYAAGNVVGSTLACTTTSIALVYIGITTSVLTPVNASSGGASTTVSSFEFEVPITSFQP